MDAKRKRESTLERLLNLFADTRAGEGVTVVLMFANIFAILTAYYILKSVREGLLIGGRGVAGLEGDELKIYASAVMAILLLGVIPAYGALASAVNRIKLLNYSIAAVVMCLALFFVLANAGVPVALPFFLWLGIVSVFLTAQFWSYANDIYSEEQGKRLFAAVAVGGSLGAILGPRIARVADSVNALMLVAAGLLMLTMLVYNVVNSRERRKLDASTGARHAGEAPLGEEGGFQLVFRRKYLLLIASMLLLTNIVNTTGEFILANAAKTHAIAEVPDPDYDSLRAQARARGKSQQETLSLVAATEERIEDARQESAKDFFADFYFYVNLAGFLIQAFLVSRIFKYLGVRLALFILPLIALGAYGAIGIIGGIVLLRVAKTAENSTDYSLQNTLRQALFLPTSREVKYKAKAAIDTFFVRIGDAGAAGLVALGLHVLGFDAAHFAFVNVGLVAVWLVVAAGIAREHRRLAPDDRLVDQA